MSTEMIVPLIAAFTSILCAGISFFASRDAQRASAKAQESSKRMEQLRLQATKVGQNLIDTMTNIIMDSGIALYYLKKEMLDKNRKEALKRAKSIGKQIPVLRRLLYSSAIYTTPEITHSIEDVLDLFSHSVDLTVEAWQPFDEHLRQGHRDLAKLFHDAYLTEGSL